MRRTQHQVAQFVARGLAVTMLVMGLPVVGILVAQRATAAPYGGCDEAWQAPRSQGARWCRSHGWFVSRRLVVNPRAVVRYSHLPACAYEDGSGGRRPCAWNGQSMGNRYGLSYWIDRRFRAHYVWANGSPATGPWRWVTQQLGDVLAESGYPHADRIRWERCVTRTVPNGWRVRCPNGTTVTRTVTETSTTF